MSEEELSSETASCRGWFPRRDRQPGWGPSRAVGVCRVSLGADAERRAALRGCPQPCSLRAPATALRRGERGEEQSPGEGGSVGVMLTLPVCSVPSAWGWALPPVLPAEGCSGLGGSGGQGPVGAGGSSHLGAAGWWGRGGSQAWHCSLSFLCPVHTAARGLNIPLYPSQVAGLFQRTMLGILSRSLLA